MGCGSGFDGPAEFGAGGAGVGSLLGGAGADDAGADALVVPGLQAVLKGVFDAAVFA